MAAMRTATFCVANRIASTWLRMGEAFGPVAPGADTTTRRSGTSRGAWVAVGNHVRELATRAGRAITVVGIGDMSDDVFGKPCSPRSDRVGRRLDHRECSSTSPTGPLVAERRRLFEAGGRHGRTRR